MEGLTISIWALALLVAVALAFDFMSGSTTARILSRRSWPPAH